MVAPVGRQEDIADVSHDVDVVTVLIAEASPPALFALRALLGDDGRFEVVGEVYTGEGLVDYEGEPRVVLVDLALPGLNAHDAVAAFRPGHPRCSIVVMAPVEAEYLRQAMISAGADDYVVVTNPKQPFLDRLSATVTATAAATRIPR